MKIEQEIQNILDRNFTRGDNDKAFKELLVLYRQSLITYENTVGHMDKGEAEQFVDEYLSNTFKTQTQ